MTLKIISGHTYKVGAGQEKNTGESQTIQGEAHSIQELLERIINGSEEFKREPIYFDVEDIEKITKFYAPNIDLTDLDELKAQNIEMGEMLIRAEKAQEEAEAAEIEEEVKAPEAPILKTDKPEE